MAASDWTWKQHDRRPSIQATLTAGGSPVDLTGCTVKFIMAKASGGTAVVNAAAVIVDPTGGVVRYDPAAADTATTGSFQAEWQVTDAGGKSWTFPTLSYHSIAVVADLDGA